MSTKRFVGRSSASLADGRVVFPGDLVDLPNKDWQNQGHLDPSQFIDAEPAPAADVDADYAEADAEDAPAPDADAGVEADEAPSAPAPAKRAKTTKSDKE